MQIPSSKPGWSVAEYVASLSGSLSGSIDLTRPERGLVAIKVAGQELEDMGMLGLQPPSAPARVADRFVREADLAVAYAGSDVWPIEPEVLWRFGAPAGGIASLDVMVSVHTQLLESCPTIAVVSEVGNAELLRLVDVAQTRFDRVAGDCDWQASRPGCLLARLAGDLSYIQMVHPADFQLDRIDRVMSGWRLSHRLFVEQLERGVILRGRVRGVFVRRQDDVERAAELYRDFAASEPPLGA